MLVRSLHFCTCQLALVPRVHFFTAATFGWRPVFLELFEFYFIISSVAAIIVVVNRFGDFLCRTGSLERGLFRKIKSPIIGCFHKSV